MGVNETGVITLRILAQDLASGNVSKFLGGIDRMAKQGGIVGSVFQGVGQSFGQMLNPLGLVTRGVGMVTDALGDAVQSAIEDEKATALLTQTIQANVKAWDGNLDAVNAAIDAGAKLAFTDDEVRDGLNQLIPRTKDVAEAIKLNGLAMDLARAKGMGLEEAATLVGKAYSGQATALRRAGIAIKDTKNSTAALAELQRSVNGQAKTYANTTEGAMKRMDIQTSEALESIGYAIKPVVGAFISFAADAIPDVISGIGNLGDAFDDLRRFLDPTYRDVQDFETAIRQKAAAMYTDADAVIEWKKATDAATAAQQRATEEAAAAEADIQQKLADQRYALEKNGVAQEEVNRQLAEYESVLRGAREAQDRLLTGTNASTTAGGKAVDTINAYWAAVDEVTASWEALSDEAKFGNKAWSEQNQLMADNAILLKGAFADLPADLQKALVDAGIVVRKSSGDLAPDPTPTKKAIRFITQAYAGGVVDMQKTIADGRDRIVEEFRLLAWQEKHPFAATNYEDWLRARARGAMTKMKQAAKDGRPDLVAEYKALYDEITAELKGLPGYAERIAQATKTALTFTVQTGFYVSPEDIMGPGNPVVPKPKTKPKGGRNGRRGGRRNHRADGGPVYPFQTYTVGEYEEETLVMGAAGGYVIPGPGGGGGASSPTVIVNLDWQTLAVPTEAEANRIADRLGPALARRLARVGA